MDPIEAMLGMSGLAGQQQPMPQQLSDQSSGYAEQAMMGALLQALMGGQLPMSGPPGMTGAPPGMQSPGMGPQGMTPPPPTMLGPPPSMMGPQSGMGQPPSQMPPPPMGGGMYPR